MVNIAELLEDAQKGMKLYSPLFGDVEYCYIGGTNRRIWVCTKASMRMFSMDGRYCFTHDGNTIESTECLLFPSKECRTWENFKLTKPKFKAHDWVVSNGQPAIIYELKQNYYLGKYLNGHDFCHKYTDEDKLHLWSIADAKDGDVLVTEDYIFIFKYILHGGVHLYCHYDIDDEEFDSDIPDAIIGNIHDKGAHFQPAAKGQRDLLFDKMKKSGYQWDADKKELRNIINPKFKVGDWIANDYCAGKVIALTDDAYLLDSGQGIPFSCEHNAHLWTIEDAKDGDVLAADECYVIFKEIDGLNIKCYCTYHYMGFNPSFHIDTLQNKTAFHPATKEQREVLFDKMKGAGYQWDEKKKELRRIIKPKFKVGDNIKNGNQIDTIAEVGYATRSYYCESGRTIYFANQDLWHLVPKPHYDIKNFKPFQKVLVRDSNRGKWRCAWFSDYDKKLPFSFITTGADYKQCIPFEGNETLLGTTDMCDEQYINW